MEKCQSHTATGALVPGQAGPPDGPNKGSGNLNTDDCVLAINYAYKNGTKWIIITGRLLLEAKAQLPHGQWMEMFNKSRLKFSLRSAETLMAIARNPALLNSKNLSNFPPAASVLYVLSHLPAEVVEQAISKGVIHPELKLVEARHLVQSHTSNLSTAPADHAPPPFDLKHHEARLTGYLRRLGARWPVVHRAQLADLLEAMAKELRNRGKE